MPDSDETIHYQPNALSPSACGVDVMHTPYTYGSDSPEHVTCPECKKVVPAPESHRYAVKYLIVDSFGEPLWTGNVTLNSNKPFPEGEEEAAAFHVRNTAKTIRKSCDAMGAPAGRVVITASFPIA